MVLFSYRELGVLVVISEPGFSVRGGRLALSRWMTDRNQGAALLELPVKEVPCT